jgi:hypothetical protein
MTAVEIFIVLGPWANAIKLFTVVNYKISQ